MTIAFAARRSFRNRFQASVREHKRVTIAAGDAGARRPARARTTVTADKAGASRPVGPTLPARPEQA
jgi:hypothetical protein